MGGNLDVDVISKCVITNLQLSPKMKIELKGPKIGLKEMREYLGVYDRPLFGSIVKPKIGLNPKKHLELVKALVEGGSEFIKEDEILGNQDFCPMEDRLGLVSDYIKSSGAKVYYCTSIHSDPLYLLEKVKMSAKYVNGVHVNFWCGLGIYKSIRELDLNILLHFQKSGDKILNERSHKFHIDESVIFELVSRAGCGTLHSGMIGGYYQGNEQKTIDNVNTLVGLNSVPALSCGMKPELVKPIYEKLGHSNFMCNVGGAIFSHPDGTLAGVKAMAKAVRNIK